MIIHSIHRFLPSILISSLLFSLPLKDEEIKNFIDARYSGDSATVYSMISENFIYEHTAYVGLGIEAHYVDGSLLITHVVVKKRLYLTYGSMYCLYLLEASQNWKLFGHSVMLPWVL